VRGGRGALASDNQGEVATNTGSFLSALRAALRQDPDVILIGGMRDTETVRTSHAGNRDRAPGPVDAPPRGHDRDRQPRRRLSPNRAAGTGPAHAGRGPEGDHLSAPGPG